MHKITMCYIQPPSIRWFFLTQNISNAIDN
nr:MAG TPA_asm: hypothetical protein [Caudoviricetes sp.]